MVRLSVHHYDTHGANLMNDLLNSKWHLALLVTAVMETYTYVAHIAYNRFITTNKSVLGKPYHSIAAAAAADITTTSTFGFRLTGTFFWISLQVRPGLSIFPGLFTHHMPFLLPNQQCQSKEGIMSITTILYTI